MMLACTSKHFCAYKYSLSEPLQLWTFVVFSLCFILLTHWFEKFVFVSIQLGCVVLPYIFRHSFTVCLLIKEGMVCTLQTEFLLITKYMHKPHG